MADKLSKDSFPHKQLSEHAKIKNTDNIDECGKPEARKPTEKWEFI